MVERVEKYPKVDAKRRFVKERKATDIKAAARLRIMVVTMLRVFSGRRNIREGNEARPLSVRFIVVPVFGVLDDPVMGATAHAGAVAV